jgi:alkylation response protein AidB-like acyl-CoA dehydrogenase
MTSETVDAFKARARRWLDANAPRRDAGAVDAWGVGSDSVALFQNLSPAEELAHIDAARDWIRRRAAAGLANLTWEQRWGGAGLTRAHSWAYRDLEAEYEVPPRHEIVNITTHLIAPTIRAWASTEQQDRFLRPMLRTDELWGQLFSEPGAGSDLAGVSTRAERDGSGWVLNGQKVWTSGAQFATWGYALCRTSADRPKHAGLTAFIVDLASAGVEVRPLRQATGGSSFNEVFLTDVLVPDERRLGPEGGGWRVAMTTLGFERSSSSGSDTVLSRRLITLAQHLGRSGHAVVRQRLAAAYTRERLNLLTTARVDASLRADQTPGPEGSVGKLAWTTGLALCSDAASTILGPRLGADAGEWGTYCWVEHLLGAAGYRVAGGTDEIQRNIIGERVLGLPR